MNVWSSKDSLLVGTFSRSDVPFVVNADEIKRLRGECNRRQQRLRQDRKSGCNRRRIREEMNAISGKMTRRLNAVCHQAAACVVEKARRMKVATIALDLTVKSYIDSFPWFDLTQKIKEKAELLGIDVMVTTLDNVEPDVDKPHVYFKLSPTTNRIKIGLTGMTGGKRHGSETDSPEELIILAVDNKPKTKLRAREKHFHALFQEHRVKGEWFHAEPVIAWLREAGWFGNTGNLSQIAQVLDVSRDASTDGLLKADSERPLGYGVEWCSQNADNTQGYAENSQPALAVADCSRSY